MTALHELTQNFTTGGALSAEDALAIRRRIWPDGRIDEAEAEQLFAMNDAVAAPSREWVDCFVEAMVEHVVHQGSPRGYVDEAKAAWLIERVRRDGRVGSLGELELLVAVVEKSVNAPASFKSFVLDEIERGVLTGEGPTRGGGTLDPGCVNVAEVALLRRVLFAPAGDGPACVSAGEAEMLFRIKDATLGAPNAPEWERLFVQGVANFLTAYTSYQPLKAGEAQRLDAFMNDRRVNIGGFLGRVVGSIGSTGAREALRREETRDHDAERATANAVTPAESAWLRERIERDGELDAMERALLTFLEHDR